MIVDYKIHEVSEYINWIYFFHAWGFQPKFAAIADIHGCDSCRAMWLTSFTEEDRPKANLPSAPTADTTTRWRSISLSE